MLLTFFFSFSFPFLLNIEIKTHYHLNLRFLYASNTIIENTKFILIQEGVRMKTKYLFPYHIHTYQTHLKINITKHIFQNSFIHINLIRTLK